MSLMIESMESRVLLSASAAVIEGDLAAGTAALVTAKADLKLAVKEAALDIKGFKTDVKGLKLTKPQKSALITLEKVDAVDAARLNAAVARTLSSGAVRGVQLAKDLKSLSVHPASVAIQLKVAVALVKLEGVFSSTVISNLETEATTAISTVDADLTAVAAAIPSTQTTVNTAESDLADDIVLFSTDAATIENVITALATDLA